MKRLKFFHAGWLTLLLIMVLGEIKSQVADSIVPKMINPEKILRKIDVRSITQSGFNFWNDRFSGHWAGIHFGFNGFFSTDYSGYSSEFMENDLFRSNSAFVNPFQQSIALQRNKNTFGLVSGLGVQFQSYRLDKNMTIRQDGSGRVMPKPLISYEDNQKSKLSVVYLTVPLLAEIQVPVKNYQTRYYFSAGVYAGMRINSHTKIKYRDEGEKEKLKTPDDYSLNKFKYGLMVRTGYRWANFYATTDLSPLFISGKGPRLIPFTFGITLMSF